MIFGEILLYYKNAQLSSMSNSSHILVDGIIGKYFLELADKNGLKLTKKYYIFNLGKNEIDEDLEGFIYIGVTPFEEEKIAKFRAATQIKRILMKNKPLIIFEAEAYEEFLKNKPYSAIYNIIAEEIYAVIKAIDAENQSLLRSSNEPIIAIPLNGEEGIPDFALHLFKLLKNIGDVKVLLMNENITPSVAESIHNKLSELGLSFAVSVNRSGSLITGLVEGELSIMEFDPVSKILGDRVLDLEPEESLGIFLPYLDRIE
jgi:hypothetical protein